MSTRTTRTTKRQARSKASKTPPAPAPAPAPAKPPYARGNPLTHSVVFTDESGTCWLVYVEPAPAEPALWPSAVVLPGRRLRFDSVEESLTIAPMPAGAPFLQEQTLQELLNQARSAARSVRAVASRAARRASPAAEVPVAPKVVELPSDPVRQQLASVVKEQSGFGYRLTRWVQPVLLLAMVLKDAILPRGRGG